MKRFQIKIIVELDSPSIDDAEALIAELLDADYGEHNIGVNWLEYYDMDTNTDQLF